MSVIAAHYYNEGKRIREIPIDEHVELDAGRSGFCWIALRDPTADELNALQTTYRLHPLAIDNAMHPLCPPKLEAYNDELYVVAQTPSWSATGSVMAKQRSSPVTTISSAYGMATPEH